VRRAAASGAHGSQLSAVAARLPRPGSAPRRERPTGPALGSDTTAASASGPTENVVSNGQPVQSEPGSGVDAVRPGQRPRRRLLMIALTRAVLVLAVSVPVGTGQPGQPPSGNGDEPATEGYARSPVAALPPSNARGCALVCLRPLSLVAGAGFEPPALSRWPDRCRTPGSQSA
jgi:hypothetical protein